MQTHDMEFELTSSALNTPSILQPNIALTATPFTSASNHFYGDHDTASTPDLPSMTTSASNSDPPSSSSTDAKVSIIEDQLKQGFSESRKPTPSPFQQFITANSTGFPLEKVSSVAIKDEDMPIQIPSTADIVTVLECMTNPQTPKQPLKPLAQETNDREATSTPTGAYDPSYSPSVRGFAESPKKKFLIRSQSHTEPTSPIQSNHSLSQKLNNDTSTQSTQHVLDDDNSNDNAGNHPFVRGQDASSMTHASETQNHLLQQLKTLTDNGIDHGTGNQLRTDSNGIHHPLAKQSHIVISNNHKRPLQPATIGNNASSSGSKAHSISIPQQPLVNEVTSSDQLSSHKRQKTLSMPTNTTVVNFRSSSASSSSSTATTTIANDLNAGLESDDPRKKQIRDSNREAARRCRERRRQYIEQLEGNLEQSKAEIKRLADKLAVIERENTQLRAKLTESKMFAPSSRLSSNESIVDYIHTVIANGTDMDTEPDHQSDTGTIQRTYINRNNL